MYKNRYLTKNIVEDLKERMVFIGGPRQIGKTTLSSHIATEHFKESAYFNWDNRQDQKRIMNSEWPYNAELLILDEIHKYKNWKSFIKGEYDKLKLKYKFLVTGSAKLDVYRKGGDSLQGRYNYYRLHPFSLAEIENIHNQIVPFQEIVTSNKPHYTSFDLLEKFGGFPEPLIKQSERILRRWHNEKVDRLFSEDIRDMEFIKDINSMKLLSNILPDRIGSLLSINSIREDLDVSHQTASHWLDILESFYYQFRIYPFVGSEIRSIKKEPKLYLWDWSEITDEGARFENLIASHLLKLTHYLYDYEGYKAKLYFLRNIDTKEVDFLVTVDDKPWFAVEAKLSDTKIPSQLLNFSNKLKIPFTYQVIKTKNVDIYKNGVRLISADKFLSGLV